MTATYFHVFIGQHLSRLNHIFKDINNVYSDLKQVLKHNVFLCTYFWETIPKVSQSLKCFLGYMRPFRPNFVQDKCCRREAFGITPNNSLEKEAMDPKIISKK